MIDITRNRQVIQVYSSLVPRAFLRSEDVHGPPDQQPAYHNDHCRSHHQVLSIGGGHLYSDDNPIRSIDVPILRYGRQNHAIERQIRTPVDDRGCVRSSVFIDSADEPVLHDRSVR